ncbi:FHA domain-containing protein [Arcobacter cloacae]|uniref:Uncharacterized protein n=1 Tax=Arcobacter cloacae TaxID=1054034 RepID=A0A6M8NI72_9BACT|nr:FHA domain-containing protein [Arcobacter cloacae]QKF90099.1 hypothetical protein ACLO_1608 [Arcobacter cloacae]RXI39109.1 hypothetical protein CP963_10565 [Arcobacter cloacae]
MNELKKELISSFVPEVVLLPITKEAKVSLMDKKMIVINSFPYKIGRESRISESDRGVFVKLRIFSSSINPNNDIYLVNSTQSLEISKEHFQIEKKDNKYYIKDRNSTLGTKLNDKEIGKEKINEKFPLNDGDIIKIGSNNSEFQFQFLILKD